MSMTNLRKRPLPKDISPLEEPDADLGLYKDGPPLKSARWQTPLPSARITPAQPPNGHFDVTDSDSSELLQVFSASAEAKIWAIARKGLNKPLPPLYYPEYTEPGATEYVYRDLSFWTSGFFPGSLYLLLERRRKYGHLLRPHRSEKGQDLLHELQLNFACQWWTENLHQNAQLQATHDVGFMIGCWARPAWDLNHDSRAFETMCTAAKTLASRYDPGVGCMRSWDTCITKKYSFQDPSLDYLTIIDNMMNLDLLFYVASATGNKSMYEAAFNHAKTTQREHVAADMSTTHLVVFDPQTGRVKSKLTNQGYAHDSCWSRGQAWAITGFAQTYHWTHDDSFLQTARGCADYFLRRLAESDVPPWDFDAPSDQVQPTDTSAAMIAAYGMLLIHEAIGALGHQSEYLQATLKIVQGVCKNHLNPPARFVVKDATTDTVEQGLLKEWIQDVDIGQGETILNGATINNYEFAPRRWANHGLVYADYYFLLVGNKLLEMGVGALMLQPHEVREAKCTNGTK